MPAIKAVIKRVVKNKRKVQLYYNPSDIKKKINFKKNSDHKKFSILFAGNFGKAQNLEVIIDVAKKINKNKDDITINLIGSGNQFSKIQDLVHKNRLEHIIKFHGYLSYKGIKKHYLNANALILTLKDGQALNKTIPAKFQTYLAFGKPILVSANGEINKLVKEKNLGFSTNS